MLRGKEMSWISWTILYLAVGLICYMSAVVVEELDCRKKDGSHMDFEKYLNMSFIIFIWPPCIVLAIIALLFILLMFLCQKIADKIEKSNKKAVTLCKEDDSNTLHL